MFSLCGRHSTELHSAESTIPIPIKRVDDKSKELRSKSLRDITQNAMPPCILNPVLFNGHLSTIWTAIESSDIEITYRRKIFQSAYQEVAGSFAVDFVAVEKKTSMSRSVPDHGLPPRTTYLTETESESLGADDERPMLIVLHGLAGSSSETYVRSVLKPLCLDPPDSQKW
jgi:predicted alpha/beta-fold hydrolase